MNTPKLYIFVGYPGAGKTTVAKHIKDKTGAIHIWADQERQTMFARPTHSKQESRRLYDALDRRTEQLLKEGKSVIFDTNFNYRVDRDLLRDIAKKYNAETRLIWLTTPKAIAKERALHHNHRERNGYEAVMTEDEFNHLTDHLEPPAEDEQPIKIDGSNIDFTFLDSLLSV